MKHWSKREDNRKGRDRGDKEREKEREGETGRENESKREREKRGNEREGRFVRRTRVLAREREDLSALHEF